MSFLYKIFGNPHVRPVKDLEPMVARINALEPDMEKLSDDALKNKTQEFKVRVQNGETLDALLPEAFAVVREAGKRVMGMRHYDVQLIGGMVLHNARIAEMRTGEGKTLVATLPAYLNALSGKGVHVVTVNDYLAKRDAVWMGQIYDFLGLSVGIIQNQRVSYVYDASVKGTEEGGELDEERDETGSFKVEEAFLRASSRKESYACDITYGTNNEFGFDYLRDNMVQRVEDMVMRPGSEMHYAIVDEVDSILIDEARTPLIISAPAEEAAEQYYHFAKLVRQLKENEDYNVDEKLRSATLTEDGITKFEKWLGVENIYAAGGLRIVHHIEQALKAEVLFKRDKEYVVDAGEIIIIDEFTGRKMPGRRYSEGLHQAIEAKENVSIQRESRTLATITFQNLFRMYGKLAGMTGTAATEAEEFANIYNLEVSVIPTNRDDQRADHPDRIYKTNAGKYKAIAEKIKECHAKGQPVLVGTISVEKNEQLSAYLFSQGVAHEILNAKNHEREGEIIAQAGRFGAVTLATNMAGRGVDIKLGGTPADREDEARVKNAGGLFVLGTERHESRRIDNQLRGRAARQGDSGETQFFVSTEDDLMRIFGGDRMKAMMSRLNVPDDMVLDMKMISKFLESAQKKVEAHNFDIRKHVLKYDDVLNRQRTTIYNKRRDILATAHKEHAQLTAQLPDASAKDAPADAERPNAPEDLFLKIETPYTSAKDIVMEMIEQEIEFVVSFHTNVDEGKEWNIKEIYETAKTIVPFTDEERDALFAVAKDREESKLGDVEARDRLVSFLLKKTAVQYEAFERDIAKNAKTPQEARLFLNEIEKGILLRGIDTLWVEHLEAIDYLRASIGLRGYGQRDPLVEYKKETFGMFNQLLADIQKEVVYSFFKIKIGLSLAPSIMADDKLTLSGAKKDASEAAAAQGTGPGKEEKKFGRNERVIVTNGTETREMKYKKAEPLLAGGQWRVVS